MCVHAQQLRLLDMHKCIRLVLILGDLYVVEGASGFATVTGVFCDGALLGGFFATVNSRGFFATVSWGFLRWLEMFFATVK